MPVWARIVKFSAPALLAGMLVLVLFGVRPALNAAKTSPPAKAAAKELAAHGVQEKHVLNPPELPQQEVVRTRSQEIFEQVAEHLKREPAQSSRLLQSWIHTE